MGELKGVQMQARDIAKLCWEAGWQDLDGICVAVAVCLAESQGFTRAHNANTDGSEDFGLFQINVMKPYAKLPGVYEKLYDPAYNVERAYTLYMARGFQPWAAFNSGVCYRDSYIGRAVVGVANYAGSKLLAEPIKDNEGNPYVHKFTTPMVDYHFRVAGLAAAAHNVEKRLKQLRLTWLSRILYDARIAAKNTRP